MSDKQQKSVQTPTDAAALRKKVEEQARTMEPTSLSMLTSEEIQQILFSLRVFQIELEMQNKELRTAQAEVEAQRARYFDIYDQAPVGYCTLSEKGLILEANLIAATMLGVTRSALVKQPISRFIFKEDLDVYYLHWKQLFDPGEPQEFELRLIKPDGVLVWAHLAATAAQGEDGTPICRVVIIDITKRKEAERELIFIKNIINSSSCAIATCDLEGKMTYGNPFFLKLWKFNGPEDFLGKPFQNFWILGGRYEEVMRVLQSEGTWTGDVKGIRKDGILFDVKVSAATVLDVAGNSIALTSTSFDISERKHHEQQLSTTLSEKEILLREVHHRVKNNLAGIISIIDLQRRTLEDPNSQFILTELSSRIRSMSLVHEKLYRADSLSSIDFHDYIQALISDLRTNFGSPHIICRVDAPGIAIPLDLASPCGLIVNELMTNALKHAFPDGKPRPGNIDCQVLVRLQRDKDTYTLTVADNGIGLPAGFDWIKAKTLGMILVRILGQHQLGGHYVVNQEEGTSVTLTFTDRKKEVPVHG